MSIEKSWAAFYEFVEGTLMHHGELKNLRPRLVQLRDEDRLSFPPSPRKRAHGSSKAQRCGIRQHIICKTLLE